MHLRDGVSNALLFQFAFVARQIGFANHLSQEVDDLVGLCIDMMRESRMDATLFVGCIELLGERTGFVIELPPEAGGEDCAVRLAANDVNNLGIREELRSNHAAFEALATGFFKYLNRTIENGADANHVRRVLHDFRDLR